MSFPKLVHPWKYPTLYLYMLNLPAGINSYDETQTRSELALQVRERLLPFVKWDELPPEIAAAASAPWRPGEWVPEVVFMTLLALVRDLMHRDNESFQRFCYDMAKESFSWPVMRALMHLISPSLLLMGAAKRWSLYKNGTRWKTLSWTKDSHIAMLSYPPNIYHKCMLDGFAQSFLAALDGTRAKSGKVSVVVISSTECRYEITWHFS